MVCLRKEANIQLVVAGKNCDYDLGGGVRQTVQFLGWIYPLATVFAFPSVYEEFGIPVVEAMAHKRSGANGRPNIR